MSESPFKPERISFEICRPLEEHARQVMAWRNDPATLAMSFHREPKRWDAFWKEFGETYFCSRLTPLFAHWSGRRAAFLRFQSVSHPKGLGGFCTDISINVAPELRGRGLGRAALMAVNDFLRSEGVDSVYAEIRCENKASQRAFEIAGYESLGTTKKWVEESGEETSVMRFVRELTSPFWRRGAVMVIAEAGSNWRMGSTRRDSAMARALVDVAVEAGADAVKFQTYRPETVYVENAGQSDYLADAGLMEDIRDVFADLAMPYEMLADLSEYCSDQDIAFMSTGFSGADFTAIDPHVAVHKIASYEIGHIRLIDLAARSGKPLVMSTGATAYPDIRWAVDRFHSKGGRDLCLMQCTAKYPAPLSSINVSALDLLRRGFGVPVGLSDHSRDPIIAPLAAVALGARCVEKHFTLHNALPGPDHSFALSPEELKLMVRKIREAEMVRGSGEKVILAEERELAAFARRGLQALRPIMKGDAFYEGENVGILRPGKQTTGVHPSNVESLEGRRATRDIAAGEGIRNGDWE